MSLKRILLLSAYDAVSHQHWRRGLVQALPEYAWTVLTLPPWNFSWRIRGNSLSWAYSQREILEQKFDLIIATSMTDLSALKGMVPSLANTPSLLYFHENQFAYPTSDHAFQSVEPKITSIYAALSATRIAFNSEYNRQTFLSGVESLLNRISDHVPSGIKEQLQGKSICLPVALDNDWQGRSADKDPCFTLLWNHRWEYDKAPERLFSGLMQLREFGIDFRIHIVGQQFRKSPSVFEEMRTQLSNHIGAWGYVENIEEYRNLVRQSHVVISTALHDFQGLAILEATAAGCTPCVPDRLAYREFIPESFRYASFPGNEKAESQALAASLLKLAERHKTNELSQPPDLSHLFWPAMQSRYRQEIEANIHPCTSSHA